MPPAECTAKPAHLFTFPFLLTYIPPDRSVVLGNNPFHIGQDYKKLFAIHFKYGFWNLQ